MPKRPSSQRKEDALGRLRTEPNVWVATASLAGQPHLVPLSLAWLGDAIVVATPTDTPTVRNAAASGRARATLDSADDVVIFDTEVSVEAIESADPALVEDYVRRVGWDPRNNPGSWSILTLTPERVQVWNGVEEITGRTIMRNGTWMS